MLSKHTASFVGAIIPEPRNSHCRSGSINIMFILLQRRLPQYLFPYPAYVGNPHGEGSKKVRYKKKHRLLGKLKKLNDAEKYSRMLMRIICLSN
jgi:hypothetical protein